MQDHCLRVIFLYVAEVFDALDVPEETASLISLGVSLTDFSTSHNAEVLRARRSRATFSTDDTLRMISSPWVTESYYSENSLANYPSMSTSYNAKTSSFPSRSSSSSLRPKSTTSYGVSSEGTDTSSGLICVQSSVLEHFFSQATLPKMYDMSDAVDDISWTSVSTNTDSVSTNTDWRSSSSDSMEMSNPRIQRSRLPQIPSDSDAYPSTSDSWLSDKLGYKTPNSTDNKIFLDPFQYLTISTKHDSPSFEWIFARPRHVLFPDLINIAA